MRHRKVRGLGPATSDSYADLPDLAQALRAASFKPHDVRKVLGGNYVPVFAATMSVEPAQTVP